MFVVIKKTAFSGAAFINNTIPLFSQMAGAGSYEICRGKTPPAPVKINRKAQKNAVYGIIFHIQRSITECKQVHQNALYVKSNKLYNKAIKRYNNTCNALNIQLCMEV